MKQEEAYLEATRLYGTALARLARGYERDPGLREDLLQDIHVALWRSFTLFNGRCSLRTWVYRVAHNVAIKHIVASKRVRLNELQTLEELSDLPDPHDRGSSVDRQDALQALLQLIDRLKPADRQIMLLYLEELGADAIGQVMGLTPENVATKIHRIKKLLASTLHAGDRS